MKKHMIVMAALLLACCLAGTAQKVKPAPKNAAGFVLKNGDVLVYEVSANGDVYNFEVALKEVREALVFDWTMPQKDYGGEVTLEKAARDGATIYKNFFRDGEESVFTDTSTVWLSRKNFNEAKKGGTIMTLDGNGAERFDKKAAGVLEIMYKGRPLKLKYIQLTNGKTDASMRSLQVLDHAAQPLIVQMNLGWSIVLKEVKTL